MHAHRFGIMNFEETIVGKLTEVYQTVHLKEFTDFPKKDEKDPTKVFADIHFKKKSAAHEAYHLSQPPQLWEDRIGIKEIKREKEVS